MKIKLKAEDRLAWLQARLSGIGASDAAAAVGLSPYKTPMQLWAEKTGKAGVPQEETEPMKWGHRLQRVVADAFAEETARNVHDPGEFTIFEHHREPYLIATLDYIQTIRSSTMLPEKYEPEDDVAIVQVPSRMGVLEVKTAGYSKRDEWADAPPLHYIVQLQHQLMVTRLPFGSIAALIGGQRFVWQDIPADEEFQIRLEYQLMRFWEYVQRDEPPPALAADNRVLSDIFKMTNPDLLPGTGEMLAWDEQRSRALQTIKIAERERDEAEAKLKYAIGQHSGILLPNGVRYNWTEEQRREYTVPAGVRRTLRRHES